MTHRDHLNRRKRRFLGAFLVVLLVGLVAGAVSVTQRMDGLFLVAYLCVPALFVVLYAAVLFGFRCPSCRGQWGWIAMYSGGPTTIREGLRYCPYCAVDLDAPIRSQE